MCLMIATIHGESSSTDSKNYQPQQHHTNGKHLKNNAYRDGHKAKTNHAVGELANGRNLEKNKENNLDKTATVANAEVSADRSEARKQRQHYVKTKTAAANTDLSDAIAPKVRKPSKAKAHKDGQRVHKQNRGKQNRGKQAQ